MLLRAISGGHQQKQKKMWKRSDARDYGIQIFYLRGHTPRVPKFALYQYVNFLYIYCIHMYIQRAVRVYCRLRHHFRTETNDKAKKSVKQLRNVKGEETTPSVGGSSFRDRSWYSRPLGTENQSSLSTQSINYSHNNNNNKVVHLQAAAWVS